MNEGGKKLIISPKCVKDLSQKRESLRKKCPPEAL
jgi:hypothetical protein